MSKTKKNTLLSTVFTTGIIAAIIIPAACFFIHTHQNSVYKRLQTRDLPIFTVSVDTSENKYGSYLAGYLAQQNQDYTKSLDFFEKTLDFDTNNEKIKTMVYTMRTLQGRIDEALPLAKELNQLNRPELLTDYVLIADAFKKKDYNLAKKLLTDKADYGTDQFLKPLINAWIAVGQGQKEQAYQSLSSLKDSEDSNPFYHYYKGLIALTFQDVDTVEKSFQETSRLSQTGYPSLTTLVFFRNFYQKQGKWHVDHPDFDRIQSIFLTSPALQEVIDKTSVPLELTPQIGLALSFYDMSVALSPLKLHETSLILNELAVYLFPDFYLFHIWGGELMESAENYGEANRIYDRIKEPTDLILLKKVVNYTTENNHKKALPLLEKLLINNPSDGLLFLMAGDSSTQEKEYEKAIQFYNKSVLLLQKRNLKTETAQALLSLGAIYDKLNQDERAEEHLLQSLKLDPNNPTALNYLGYMWLDKQKNIDEAFNMVKKAYELSPEDPNIMDSMAWGYYLKQDYEKALSLAEKSTDLISFSSVAYSHLGDIYSALGRKQEAVYQYRKALDLKVDITPELRTELENKLKR